MKKLPVFIVFFLCCNSCSLFTKTYYEVVNNITPWISEEPYFNGSFYEVTVQKYIRDVVMGQEEYVGTDNYELISSGGGSTGEIEVPDGVNKIIVSFRFLPQESEYYYNISRFHLPQIEVFEGERNLVDINDSTTIWTIVWARAMSLWDVRNSVDRILPASNIPYPEE